MVRLLLYILALFLFIAALIQPTSSLIRLRTMPGMLLRSGIINRPASSQLVRYLTTNILVVGKRNSVEPWIAEGVNEYEKRLRPIMNIATQFLKNDDDLVRHCENAKGYIVTLDENGKAFTSRLAVNRQSHC